jgi:hypothetical protein
MTPSRKREAEPPSSLQEPLLATWVVLPIIQSSFVEAKPMNISKYGGLKIAELDNRANPHDVRHHKSYELV